MPAFPLLDGSYYSFQDIEFTFNGLFFIGLENVSYDDNLTRQAVRGTARQQLGMTAGHYEAKGSFEIYKPSWDILLTTIQPLGLLVGGWRALTYTITNSYAAGGLPVFTDTIIGVRIGEVGAEQAEGEDALFRKVTFYAQMILWNGQPSVIETAQAVAVG